MVCWREAIAASAPHHHKIGAAHLISTSWQSGSYGRGRKGLASEPLCSTWPTVSIMQSLPCGKQEIVTPDARVNYGFTVAIGGHVFGGRKALAGRDLAYNGDKARLFLRAEKTPRPRGWPSVAAH